MFGIPSLSLSVWVPLSNLFHMLIFLFLVWIMRIEKPTTEIVGQTDFKMAPATHPPDLMPFCNFLDPWMWAEPVTCFQPREYSKSDRISFPWLCYINSDFPLASRCYPCWLWWNKQSYWWGPYDKGRKTASSQQLTGTDDGFCLIASEKLRPSVWPPAKTWMLPATMCWKQILSQLSLQIRTQPLIAILQRIQPCLNSWHTETER